MRRFCVERKIQIDQIGFERLASEKTLKTYLQKY